MARGLDSDIEVATAQCLVPGATRHRALRYVQPDLAPFIDQPGANVFVRLVNVAVQQLEADPLGAGLLQQAARLRTRLVDVRPIPRDLLKLLFCRGQRRVRKDEGADGLDDGDFRQRLGAVPAVDRQAQGAADARVVEGLLLVVRSE